MDVPRPVVQQRKAICSYFSNIPVRLTCNARLKARCQVVMREHPRYANEIRRRTEMAIQTP